jgi:hypothetical protein
MKLAYVLDPAFAISHSGHFAPPILAIPLTERTACQDALKETGHEAREAAQLSTEYARFLALGYLKEATAFIQECQVCLKSSPAFLAKHLFWNDAVPLFLFRVGIPPSDRLFAYETNIR